MIYRYVCTPCNVVDDDVGDSCKAIAARGPSITCKSIDDARDNATAQWKSGLYDMVLVSRVDELANVSILGIVGYHELSSRYDLPLKVAEIDKTLPRIARIIRDYAERDCPVLEDV